VSWRVIIHPLAEADLDNARQWYESRELGVGDDFLFEVNKAMALLIENPQLHPAYFLNYYRIITRRFPYKLFYRLEGNNVIVMRVLHAKQDHRRWLK